MSRSGWIDYFGVVGALIIFVMIPVSWHLAYQQSHQDERRDAASYSMQAGDQLFDHCTGKTEADTLLCIANAQEADREDRERRHDLKAQQDTAEWTAAGSIIAGLGLIVTGAGIVYVAMTLNETRRATKAAIDANKGFEASTQQQLRAYVIVSHVQFFPAKRGSPPGAIIRIANRGQTPGREVELHHVIGVRTLPTLLPRAAPQPVQPVSKSVLGPEVFNTVQARFSGPITPLQEAGLVAGQFAIVVWGEIKYLDVFDMRRTTTFCYYRRGSAQGGNQAMTAWSEGNDAI